MVVFSPASLANMAIRPPMLISLGINTRHAGSWHGPKSRPLCRRSNKHHLPGQTGKQTVFLNVQQPRLPRPFHGSEQEQKNSEQQRASYPDPARVFQADEIVVPGFRLPSQRFGRRSRNTILQCIAAIKRLAEHWIYLINITQRQHVYHFISDNGMAFPFAKTNCYLNATQTPFIARWPNKIAPGSRDTQRMINGIDIREHLRGGGNRLTRWHRQSKFLPLLQGNKTGGRERVFTSLPNSQPWYFSMRCIRYPDWGYI